MSEQEYFEQFTGEDIPTTPLVIEVTRQQWDAIILEWEQYKAKYPDWWKHQRIELVTPK